MYKASKPKYVHHLQLLDLNKMDGVQILSFLAVFLKLW